LLLQIMPLLNAARLIVIHCVIRERSCVYELPAHVNLWFCAWLRLEPCREPCLEPCLQELIELSLSAPGRVTLPRAPPHMLTWGFVPACALNPALNPAACTSLLSCPCQHLAVLHCRVHLCACSPRVLCLRAPQTLP
jgi:hypothetical protein